MCIRASASDKCSDAVVASNGPVEVPLGHHGQPRGSQRYDMPNPAKQIVLGAALLVGITIVANADPLPRTGDKSAASDAGVPSGAGNFSGSAVGALLRSDATPTRDSMALPDVSVVAPNSHPYSSGVGPKAGPNGRLRVENYQATPDYVTDMAMHPYTSGVGQKVGPNYARRVEYYQVPSDYDADVAMHPPAASGRRPMYRAIDRELRPVAVSHYNR